MNLKENTTLQSGKYRIIRVLGQGGFGITYLAEHTMLENLVAIKEFFPKDYCDRDDENSHVTIGTKNSAEIVQMLQGKFIKEAKNISKLRHPGIITIHDIFQENDTAYYVMEYVEGESLSEMIKRRGPIPEDEALGYIRKVADAVGYMHSKSMNHLDIKPANIMVRKSDNEPVLIDFGLAKQYDASGGQTSTTPIGISHGFAPIEQYRPGGVATFTPQTDIYALGATLYALLTATTPPHYSDILEDGLPVLPASVSSSTATAIEKAMEVKKNNRPSSIKDFLSLVSTEINTSVNKSPKLTEREVKEKNSFMSDITDKSTEEIKVPVIEKSKNCNDHQNTNLNKEINTSTPEETVLLLNFPSAKENKSEINNKNDNDGFIDLGLSVKWASQISGIAIPIEEKYIFVLNDESQLLPEDFIQEGYQLPTIHDFEELIAKCSWSLISHENGQAYKIKGPNGNSIIIPLGTMNNYLTLETLKPDRLGYVYYLYLCRFSHSLTKGFIKDAYIWPVMK